MKLLAIIFFIGLCGTAFATGGTCPSGANYLNPATNTQVTLSSLGITNCYYVAASGSDSNNGTSETTPWLHAPQMPSCASNCATVQNQSNGIPPGTGIILRGGDAWHLGNSGASPYTGGTWNFNVSPYPMGTSTHPIYVGVDQTWYTGGSWARPVFTADNPLCNANNLGSNCFSGTDSFGQTYFYVNTCAYQVSGGSNNMLDVSGLQYYIVDNFEMTGLCQSSVGQPNGHDTYVSYTSICNQNTCASGVAFIATNLYIHGATHLKYAGPNGSGSCTGGTVCFNLWAFHGAVVNYSVGETIQNNVVDFVDSDPTGEGLFESGGYNVAYNVFRYTTQAIPGTLHIWHDNLYEYFFENGHSNMIESADVAGTNAVYNNVFRHVENLVSAGGGVFLWLGPVATTTTDYIFNNIGYDVGALEYLNISGVGITTNQGDYVFFNNTWQSNVAQPILRCELQTTGTTTDTNNHYIDDQNYILGPCNNLTTTTPLAQTNAAADANVSTHYDQYAASETYAYSPLAATNSTVGAGTNENASNGAYCSALTAAGLTAAATACQSDMTYACSYAGNGAPPVCPARTVTARPTSAAWDIGAYEYSAPPSGTDGFTGVTCTGCSLQ